MVIHSGRRSLKGYITDCQKRSLWILWLTSENSKKDICDDLFFVSCTKFKGIQGFCTKFKAISRVQGVKINSRLLKGFKKPWEPWPENATCQDVSYHCERSPYTYTPEALYGVRHHCLQTIGIYRNFIYVSFIFFLFEVGQKGRKINVFLLTNSSSISHKKTLYI